jgi:nitronate monooxygenase
MPLPPLLEGKLDLPVIGAPMLLPCHQPLTIAQCTNGIVGAFPALSARPSAQLEEWIIELGEVLAAFKKAHPERTVAPFAVNQIVHKSNSRLDQDLEICIKHKVPIIVTSLGARADLVKAVHAYGGIVFHDVISTRHAEKALEQGVDGLVLLTTGGGGHGGNLNPIAFVTEVRRFYQGPLAVSGTITSGRGIAAVQMMGADLAYMGTRFAASAESRCPPEWKQMFVDCAAADILYSPWFNGVHCSYMKPAIRAAGLDPDDPKYLLKQEVAAKMDVTDEKSKLRTSLFSGGQGVGNIDAVKPAAEIIAQLKAEYAEAMARFGAIAGKYASARRA